MAESQHFCLRWNNYQSSITSAFENLRDDEDFVDVTIACDGKSLKAHRVVLSACSPYFRELLKSTPCKHPVIVLQDVAFADLDALVEFIYHGEVNVHQRNLTSFLKTAEVLRVSGLTQQTDGREDSPLSQLASNGRGLGGEQLFNLSPAGRSPPTATSPLPTPPPPTNGSNPATSPTSVPSSATVNQLLRRAVAVAEASKRLQRNSIPTPPLGTDQNDVDHPAAKRPRSINNNSENGPITNSHLDREWEREQRDRERDREWDRDDRLCETDINANPADLTNHQMTPTDFSAKNSYRKIEVKREDRERDRDNEQSRSPSSRLMDKVKVEPTDMLPGATEISLDSIEAYHEHRGPPSTSSTGEHEDLDSSVQSHHNPAFLSDSKLFAAASGSFNFSMAALAADTALAGMNLQANADGLAGTSTQGTGGLKKVFTCQRCGKVLCSKASLKRHIADKHAQRQEEYRCVVCERVYCSRNSLMTHIYTYHKSRPGTTELDLKCLCLRHHTLISTGHYTDHISYNLSQHVTAGQSPTKRRSMAQVLGMNNWTYGVPPPMTGGINDPQECPFCRRTFSCYYSLKRHFQDKHERSDTLYKCEFCQRSYRTKNSLTTHKSLQHRGSAGMLKRLMKSVAVPGALGQPQPQP